MPTTPETDQLNALLLLIADRLDELSIALNRHATALTAALSPELSSSLPQPHSHPCSAAEAVLALHSPDTDLIPVTCRHCQSRYPCPTVRALPHPDITAQ